MLATMQALHNGVTMIPVQSRMARAATGLGVRELAAAAQVSPDTVARLERGEKLSSRTIAVIRAALEAAGVDFIDVEDGGPGVRLSNGQALKTLPQGVAPSMAATLSLPGALAAWGLEQIESDDYEDAQRLPRPLTFAALRVYEMLVAIDLQRVADIDTAATKALQPLFGGEDYVAAVLEWGPLHDKWVSSRKRDKGPMPTPPAIA